MSPFNVINPLFFEDVINFYGEYKFVEKMLEDNSFRDIFFSVGSDLKSSGHILNIENKTWKVWCMFKAKYSFPIKCLTEQFLPNIISKSVNVKLDWERDLCFDKIISPKVDPIPDWFRKRGE